MIYKLFLILAGFNAIYCRPELKFDENGNVLASGGKPFDFHKLVASKVTGEGNNGETSKKPIEIDSKSKSSDVSLEDSEESKEKTNEKVVKKESAEKVEYFTKYQKIMYSAGNLVIPQL